MSGPGSNLGSFLPTTSVPMQQRLELHCSNDTAKGPHAPKLPRGWTILTRILELVILLVMARCRVRPQLPQGGRSRLPAAACLNKQEILLLRRQQLHLVLLSRFTAAARLQLFCSRRLRPSHHCVIISDNALMASTVCSWVLWYLGGLGLKPQKTRNASRCRTGVL